MPSRSPAVVFDGDNLLILLPEVGEYDAKVDLYSDWKEWVQLADNAKYPPAFDTTGGDPIDPTTSIDAFYFLRNDLGWRIKAAEQSGDVTIQGNVFPRDFNLPSFLAPDGAFTVVFRLVVSSKALAVETATSGLTSQESAMLNLIKKLLINELITNPTTGQITLLDDDNATVILQSDIYEDVAKTQPYRGRGIEVREKLADPRSPQEYT